MTSRRHRVAAALVAAAVLVAPANLAAQSGDGAVGHLRLIDRLDRPEDGYCLDVLGTGRTLRLELPIFAHNCKRGLTPDSAVALTARGEIRFVDIDRCVAAFGVNGRALPGAPIVLRGCGEAAPFFESAPLQRFDWTAERRLRLRCSSLCLSVGDVSATTYSASDRWRMLTVEECGAVPDARAVWEFAPLG